jgi:hypothetical protein
MLANLLLIVVLGCTQSYALDNCPASSANATNDCFAILSENGCGYYYNFVPDSRTAWTGVPWECTYASPDDPNAAYCVESNVACFPLCQFDNIKTLSQETNCSSLNADYLCAESYVDTGAGYRWCMWDEYTSECVGPLPCYV